MFRRRDGFDFASRVVGGNRRARRRTRPLETTLWKCRCFIMPLRYRVPLTRRALKSTHESRAHGTREPQHSTLPRVLSGYGTRSIVHGPKFKFGPRLEPLMGIGIRLASSLLMKSRMKSRFSMCARSSRRTCRCDRAIQPRGNAC